MVSKYLSVSYEVFSNAAGLDIQRGWIVPSAEEGLMRPRHDEMCKSHQQHLFHKKFQAERLADVYSCWRHLGSALFTLLHRKNGQKRTYMHGTTVPHDERSASHTSEVAPTAVVNTE